MVQKTGVIAIITDREKVIAASGGAGKALVGENISRRLERILDDRDEQLPVSERNRFIPVADGMAEEGEQIFSVIRSGGEIVGAVFLQSKDGRRKMGELERKITAIAAEFLGKQVNV